MKLTTLDIIKLLPFEENYKRSLIDAFDSLSEDQRYEVTELVWSTYGALYRIKYNANMEKALSEIADQRITLGNDFYKKIKEKTDQDMDKLESQQSTPINLDQTRQELQNILNR